MEECKMAKKKAKQSELNNVVEEIQPQEQEQEANTMKTAPATTPKSDPILRHRLGTVEISAWLNSNTKGERVWINIKVTVDYKKDGEWVRQKISMNVDQMNKLIDCLNVAKIELLQKYPQLLR